jgi:hypothetical protein
MVVMGQDKDGGLTRPYLIVSGSDKSGNPVTVQRPA